MKHSEPTFYILCGLPFSGKTFLAEKMMGYSDFCYVSIDEILFNHGFSWDRFKEYDEIFWNEIFQESYEKTASFLKQGKSVIYDSANQDRTSRDKLRELAQEHGVIARVIHLNIPEHIIWERWENNKTSNERFDLSKDLMEQTIKMYEQPTDDENVIRYSGENMQEWIKEFIAIRDVKNNNNPKSIQYIWHKSNTFLALSPITQVYGVCFNRAGEILIIHEPGKEWNIPGGKPEKNETPMNTLHREVREETSVIIGKSEMIGYFEMIVSDIKKYQLRFACLVDQICELTIDPATGMINERKFIAPDKFFDIVRIDDYRPMIQEALNWLKRQRDFGWPAR